LSVDSFVDSIAIRHCWENIVRHMEMGEEADGSGAERSKKIRLHDHLD